MDLPDPKSLKKLAAACRKAGIKTIKFNGVEITLSDDLPQKPKAKDATKRFNHDNADILDKIESDGLTDEQLLFYSTQDPETIGQSEQ